MGKLIKFFVLLLIPLIITFFMNYGLAKLGEPRSLWIMQMLGVM